MCSMPDIVRELALELEFELASLVYSHRILWVSYLNMFMFNQTCLKFCACQFLTDLKTPPCLRKGPCSTFVC